MTHKNGPWTIRETNQKYRDSYIKVTVDQVIRPDGELGTYSTVEMKPGIAVLPLDKDGIVHLTRQFRYSLGKESIEVVCGAIEDNEPPLEAAKREIEEEVGIKAEEWINLGILDLDTSIIHCPVHLFLAKQLTFTATNQEGTETIEKFKVPFEQAVQMVMDSQITHSPSCALILKSFIHQG